METGTGTRNVPTKEFAIETLESARAFMDTKARLVDVNHARAIALVKELAST